MDVRRAWKLGGANRAWMGFAAMGVLLLASVTWNVCLYRSFAQLRAQGQGAAQVKGAAAASADMETESARLRRKAKEAENSRRIQQLYEEINHLTRVSEQVLVQRPGLPGPPAKKDERAQKASGP